MKPSATDHFRVSVRVINITAGVKSILMIRLFALATLAFLAAGAWTARCGETQWTNVGLDRMAVNTITAGPGTIYAGTQTGLFRSDDSGASWSSAGLVGFNVHQVAIDPVDPNTLYAGGPGGLFAISLDPKSLNADPAR